MTNNNTMKIVYFYVKDGKKIGPLNREQLDGLHLASNTLVWYYGLTDWIPYKDLPKKAPKQAKPSLFDSFRAWIKSKKKESAPKAEVQPTPIVVTPQEKPIVDTTLHTNPKEEIPQQKPNVEISQEEPKVESVEKVPTNQQISIKRSKRTKRWLICIMALVIIAVIVFLTIWMIDKNNIRKAENQKQMQIRELVQKGDDALELSLYELASKYYREAVEMDSTNWALYYLYGSCYYKQNLYSTACVHFEKAYHYNTNHSSTLIYKDSLTYELFLYRYASSMQQARPSNSKMMELSQEYCSLYPYKSEAYRTMTFAYLAYAEEYTKGTYTWEKNISNAMQWANMMVEKFPYESDSYFCLAYIQRAKGDTYKAIVNYKKCIEIKPGGSAYNNLGCCYSDINNYQEAYKCWRKAIELGENECAPNNLKRHGQRVE